MNGFEALSTFSRWDGTAEGLVPCLEAIEAVLSSMLDSVTTETDAQKRKIGASVLALLSARSKVQSAHEDARGGGAPDPIAVTRLVAEAGAAMFWGLAVDAIHGIKVRVSGHRQSTIERDLEWARWIDALEEAGERQPYAKLHRVLEAKGEKPPSREGIRRAVWRARKSPEYEPNP